MTPKEIAKKAAQALDSKRGQDIRILQVTELTALADFFVIATGTSTTHVKTLSEECEHVLKEMGETPRQVEGRMAGNWLLLDFGCVIVHVFLPETRSFYSIERLWSDAKVWSEEEL